jgi:1,2-diacylglycerol 3-beta-galactosyltransferase
MASQPSESEGRKRILILTADAGFGHRSAALAIEAAMQARHGGQSSTFVINPLRQEGSPGVLQTLAEDHYDGWVQNDAILYELGYRLSDSVPTAALIEQVYSILLYDSLKNLLIHHSPDVVVCTYPFYLEPLNFVFRSIDKSVPLISVITDLVTVHALWLNPQVDLCLVPTSQVRQKALRSGVPANRIRVTGLPVHPHFGAESRLPAQIRAELGWKADMPTILIVGGKRVLNVLAVARLIDRSGLGARVQLAIVAGGDEALYDRLTAQTWRGEVHLYGYVEDMPAMIHASDVVMSKAGGLIVSETLACGRPLILISAISGQETGNVEYVTSAKAGEWAPNPVDALACLVRWLADEGAILAQCTANARRVGKPKAVYEAVDLVWELAETGPQVNRREVSFRGAARLPLKAGIQVSRAVDKLEQDLRGVTDAELARLAVWCINQIETESELKRIAETLHQRIKA